MHGLFSIIVGVVGPDEFHTADPRTGKPGVTDNAYTNLFAAWVLLRAWDALDAIGGGRTG